MPCSLGLAAHTSSTYTNADAVEVTVNHMCKAVTVSQAPHAGCLMQGRPCWLEMALFAAAAQGSPADSSDAASAPAASAQYYMYVYTRCDVTT